MLLLAVLAISISLIRDISQAKETALLGTWQYKEEEGVIFDTTVTRKQILSPGLKEPKILERVR